MLTLTAHPSLKNRVIATQKTFVHDAICLFVAFSLTDFVSCGFANFFLTLATSAKNAGSDFFALGTFHHSLITSLVILILHSFRNRNLPITVGAASWATAARMHPFPGSDAARRTGDRRLLLYSWLFFLISCLHRYCGPFRLVRSC